MGAIYFHFTFLLKPEEKTTSIFHGHGIHHFDPTISNGWQMLHKKAQGYSIVCEAMSSEMSLGRTLIVVKVERSLLTEKKHFSFRRADRIMNSKYAVITPCL